MPSLAEKQNRVGWVLEALSLTLSFRLSLCPRIIIFPHNTPPTPIHLAFP